MIRNDMIDIVGAGLLHMSTNDSINLSTMPELSEDDLALIIQGLLEVDEYGSKFYLDDKYQLHREDGPAVIRTDGSEQWLKHGKMHRVDGPAHIRPDGSYAWYYEGNCLRIGGPAMFTPASGESFWVHGTQV